jgi:tripartite-type tricarboxylate transporter receptor subunit TctC
MRWLGFCLVLSALALLAAAPTAAQSFPSREIHVVCGFPAGSGADVFVRFFAEQIKPFTDKPVIVENKPGALSSIGAEYVARSRPDGHTIFITGAVPLTANLFLLKKLNYDPVKDFSPVSMLLWQPVVLMVNPKLPVKSVAELTTYLKVKGMKATYGGVSASSIGTAEIYKSMTGVTAVQVPYKEAIPALNEMLEGSLDFIFGDPVVAMENYRSGRVRVLAVSTRQRVATAPEIPTMIEAGIPDYEWTSWWAAMLPAGVPPDTVATLNGWFRQILAKAEVKAFLNQFAAEPFPSTPAELTQRQVADIERWRTLFKSMNIEPQ